MKWEMWETYYPSIIEIYWNEWNLTSSFAAWLPSLSFEFFHAMDLARMFPDDTIIDFPDAVSIILTAMQYI